MFPSPTYIDSIVTLVLLPHCELAAFPRVNFFQPGLQWARSHPSDKGCRVSQAPATTEPLLPFNTWPLLHCMTLLLLLSVSNQRTHSSSLSATKYWRFLQSMIFRYRSGNLHIYYHYIKGGLHPNTDALPISRSFNNGQTPLLYGSWKNFSSEKKKVARELSLGSWVLVAIADKTHLPGTQVSWTIPDSRVQLCWKSLI